MWYNNEMPNAIKIQAKFDSACKTCDGKITAGSTIFWTPGTKNSTHVVCPQTFTHAPGRIAVEKRLSLEPPAPREDFPGLFEHQREVVNTIEKRPDSRLYLAWAPGLGKTLGSLASAQVSNNFPLIIVCPSVVKINWQREVKQWIDKDAQILSSRTPYQITSDVVIINYEVLDDWKRSLIDLNAKGIVFDEVHYIKNPDSKRTKAAIEVADTIDGMRYGLSGTPTPNSVYDLVGPLTALGVIGDFGGPRSFVNRYCPPVQTQWGVSHAKTYYRKELRQNLVNSCFVRRRREDCLDLPEKIRQDIPLDIATHMDEEFYGPLADEMRKGTLDEALKALQSVDRMTMEGQLAAERHDAGMAKIEDIVSLATGIDDPLVIMIHHRDVADALMTKLKKRRPVKLVGGMTPKARQQSIDDFQEGRTDLMIASISAAGVGINLQRGTAMIMGELPLTYADLEQAESRCHRSGAKNDLTVYRMVGLGTADEILVNILARKEAVSAAVEDGIDIATVTSQQIMARRLLDFYRAR